MAERQELFVVMGPSGCGKSTIARMLAEQTGAPFVEADDFHPKENKAKMSRGIALCDADRVLWLDHLLLAIKENASAQLWLACSALTPFVQTRLRRESARDVQFILLQLPANVLEHRLKSREGHFMSPALLESQIEALDVPADVLEIDAHQPPASVVAAISQALNQSGDHENHAKA